MPRLKLRPPDACCSQAAANGADVVHFSECCLSGYAGVEFNSFEGFDWPALIQGTFEIRELARALAVWVVVGSAHRLTGNAKPHNCMYIIDDNGAIVDRYDKLFAVGSTSEDDADLAHYSPGSHFSVFEVKGVRCGVLICHDFRYDELYREYFRRGVQLMLHSYHNGHSKTDVVGAGSTSFARNYADRNSYGGEWTMSAARCFGPSSLRFYYSLSITLTRVWLRQALLCRRCRHTREFYQGKLQCCERCT